MYNSLFCQNNHEQIQVGDTVTTGQSFLFIDLPVFLNGIEINEEDYKILHKSNIRIKDIVSIDTINENGYQSFRYSRILLETNALFVVDNKPIVNKEDIIYLQNEKKCKLRIDKILDRKEGKSQYGKIGENGVVFLVKSSNKDNK